MSTVYKAVPVRRDGKRWIMTAEHKAEAWTVGVFRKLHQVTLSPMRRLTKIQAATDARAMQRAAEGPLRQYKLGNRMPKRKEA